MNYTHLLTSTPQDHEPYFKVIHIVDGYERVKLKRPKELVHSFLKFFKIVFLHHDEKVENLWVSWLPIHIITEQKVWIMKRNS